MVGTQGGQFNSGSAAKPAAPAAPVGTGAIYRPFPTINFQPSSALQAQLMQALQMSSQLPSGQVRTAPMPTMRGNK